MKACIRCGQPVLNSGTLCAGCLHNPVVTAVMSVSREVSPPTLEEATLRDLFAAAVLAGVLADYSAREVAVMRAWQVADLMLAWRSKGG